MTTIFGTVVETPEFPAVAAATPKKHGWLPLLTVLFLLSYGLMTMLIIEQGQTIESQRALIRELFQDSAALSASKLKAQHDARAQAAATQNPSTQIPSTHIPSAQAPLRKAPSNQTPSTQTPSTQAPSSQTPSTQAQSRQAPSSQVAPPQQRAQIQTKPKSQFQMPSKPAADLQDSRRSLITI